MEANKQASRGLGDLTVMWDVCSPRSMCGICLECQKRSNTDGCQKYWAVSTLRGLPDSDIAVEARS